MHPLTPHIAHPRWASRSSPYAPFITGYLLRILVSAALLVITAAFPPGAASLSEHAGPFGALAVVSLVGSFASTLTFTALGSLFNRSVPLGQEDGRGTSV